MLRRAGIRLRPRRCGSPRALSGVIEGGGTGRGASHPSGSRRCRRGLRGCRMTRSPVLTFTIAYHLFIFLVFFVYVVTFRPSFISLYLSPLFFLFYISFSSNFSSFCVTIFEFFFLFSWPILFSSVFLYLFP